MVALESSWTNQNDPGVYIMFLSVVSSHINSNKGLISMTAARAHPAVCCVPIVHSWTEFPSFCIHWLPFAQMVVRAGHLHPCMDTHNHTQ